MPNREDTWKAIVVCACAVSAVAIFLITAIFNTH